MESDPWALVKKLTSTYKPPCIPTLKKECGSYTTDDLDTCNYLLEKWFPDDDLSNESDYHKAVRDHVQSFLREGFECPPPITDYEMGIAKSISPLKASGSDLIKGIVLQNLSQENLAVIKNLFTLCLEQGVFPTAWKTGEGSILPKPDRPDSESYKSYRGITLLSVLGKWFEKILLKRLMWTSPGSHRFSKYQFGFIPGRSCEDALCSIVARIERAFIEHKFVLIILLDITGAFDCTWPPSIIKSLIDKGIDPGYIHILQSYLSNRLIRIKINKSAAQKNLTRSAPQGGGLSPFLWNSNFDDILGQYELEPNILPSLINECEIDNYVQAFADDSQLVIISDSLFLCQTAGNNILSQMLTKADQRKATYSASKSNAVVFSKRPVPFEVNITLGKDRIPVSGSSKLLGVTLDSKLNWGEHVNKQTASCKRLVFLLNHCCKMKWGVNRDVLEKIWIGCIEKILMFGCPAWVSLLKNKSIVQKIESVQRLVAIKMIRAFRTVSFDAALKLSGLPYIVNRIHERVISYAAKHPNHYTQFIPNSHIEYTLQIAAAYGIDIAKYESTSLQNTIPPYCREKASVSTTLLNEYPLFQKSVLNIYTDGSKSDAGTGCAFVVFRPNMLLEHGQARLGIGNSVYQAELVAIRNSLIHLFTLPIRECFSKINIYSDSLSSLNSIDDCEPKNSLVKEIQKYIRFFSKFTEVHLAWCKGHVKILGNELADYFAKDAVSNPLIPSEELSLPISHLKDTIRKKSKSMLTERWEQSENGRLTHDFIPSETPQHVYENNSHKMTQILTGHCRLNFYLNSIGKSLNPVCDCGLAIETVPHYLFYCPLENENRANTLIKTCFQLGLSFPPNPAALISNKVLYCSLQFFLSRSSRLNFS